MPRCAVSGGTQNTTQPIPPRASITIVVRKEDLSPLFDASMCGQWRYTEHHSTYSTASLNHNSGKEGGFIPALRCPDVRSVEVHRTPLNLFHREPQSQ